MGHARSFRNVADKMFKTGENGVLADLGPETKRIKPVLSTRKRMLQLALVVTENDGWNTNDGKLKRGATRRRKSQISSVHLHCHVGHV